MSTLRRSLALGAAFSAGIAIAAMADPPYPGGVDSSRSPGPQTASLPPANSARASGGATQRYEPLAPSLQALPTGHDGSYTGWMTEQVRGNIGSNFDPRACVSRRPVSMTIEHGNVTISYVNWGGETMHYRGKADAAGRIETWHTNGDATRSVLTGQVGQDGFTGYMQRGRAGEECAYRLAMLPAAVTPRP